MTWTLERNLDMDNMNHHVKCLCQSCFRSNVIAWTHTQGRS